MIRLGAVEAGAAERGPRGTGLAGEHSNPPRDGDRVDQRRVGARGVEVDAANRAVEAVGPVDTPAPVSNTTSPSSANERKPLHEPTVWLRPASRQRGHPRWVPARMKFYKYEAREIVEPPSRIPVTELRLPPPPSRRGAAAAEIGGPVVIKSQVLTGGRMKAGGVKFADTPEEAAEHAAAILELEINGHAPRGVLVDPKAEVAQEYYAGVVWDGTRKRP